MSKSRLFTAILDTYNRPALLREAVEALRRQTYENLEIILVNNGGTAETVEYLHGVAASDHRVKLVHFRENQYSLEDPLKMLDVCLNAGLEAAKGDYVCYQADDDLIAQDYAEKMVALFQGNPECTTAAGIPVGIDIHATLLDKGPRTSNFRSRYMPGRLLALDYLRGGRTLFSAPGSIFTIKREALIAAGGYHRSIELSQICGILPFGVTGFDETAIFYWRRHEGQLNTHLSARGWLGIKETFSLMKDWQLERRWRVFGPDAAKEVVSKVEGQTCDEAAHWFVLHLYSWRFKSCARVLREIWRHWHFWQRVLFLATRPRAAAGPFWRLLKPPLRRALGLLPGTISDSPRLARLRERIKRRAGQS